MLHIYASVFDDKLGTMHNFKSSLQVQEGAIPRFHHPWPVPFALREAVERELDQLESAGILKQVSSCSWAAPIVAVHT